MSKYIPTNYPAVDAIIRSDLDMIVDRLKQFLGEQLLCVQLTGGFGRGEGGVIITPEGDVRPANDYDLLVIVRNPTRVQNEMKAELATLQRELDEAARVKQVDLVFKSPGFFRLPAFKVVHYENKYGSQCLFGAFPSGWPVVSGNRMPLIEGTTYFRTRGGGLLIAAVILEKEQLPELMRIELAALEMNKAYLAIGDAILIRSGEYHYSYAKRRERFMQLDDVDDELKSQYSQATDCKFELDLKNIDLLTLKSELPILSSLFVSQFLAYESIRQKRDFQTIQQYEAGGLGTRSKFPFSLQQLKSRLNSEFTLQKVHDRVTVMSLLGCLADSREAELLSILQKMGLKLEPSQTFRANWDRATENYLHAWHPQGIIDSVLGVDTAHATQG